jgi:hypothetical protein
VDPAGRYAEIQEMRKAIDTLLFSGDFTPTTFNLAFFMHSLFREDIERESKLLKEEKESSYLEFLTDDAARPTTSPGTLITKAPTPPPAPSTPSRDDAHRDTIVVHRDTHTPAQTVIHAPGTLHRPSANPARPGGRGRLGEGGGGGLHLSQGRGCEEQDAHHRRRRRHPVDRCSRRVLRASRQGRGDPTPPPGPDPTLSPGRRWAR